MKSNVTLVLASQSPRRRELMQRFGIPYEADAPEVDEACDLPPRDAVLEIARRKARRGAELHPGCAVLAADTLVALGGRPLGKPHSEAEAAAMLRSLSGRRHQVYTGVCLLTPGGQMLDGVDASTVVFDTLTEDEIAAYIATGEPMDKAGAYALQGIGGQWVVKVEGSPSGVIGLPLHLTRRLLREAGLL